MMQNFANIGNVGNIDEVSTDLLRVIFQSYLSRSRATKEAKSMPKGNDEITLMMSVTL